MRLRTFLVVLLFLATSLCAFAQENGPDKKEEARKHFERGNELLADDSLPAALAEFRRSRELYPTRGNTQNLAVALAKLHRYDEALEMYAVLFSEFQLAPDEKAAVEREIAILKELVGTLVVNTEPGASVEVDGRLRGTAPLAEPLTVSAGVHKLRVVKAGRIPFEDEIEIAGGRSLTVTAKLQASVERQIVRTPGKTRVVLAPRKDETPPGAPMFGVLVGPSLATGLGGPLEDQCDADCDGSLAIGISAAARGGWHFGSGVEIGAELGYLQSAVSYDNREDFLEPQGSGEQPGRADDHLSLRGFSFGAFAGYSRTTPLVLRVGLGAGALLGRIRDERTGGYDVVPASGGSYRATPTSDKTRSGTFGYLLPEAFAGFEVARNVQLGFGLGVLALVALSTPRYPRDDAVVVTTAEGLSEYAYFRDDALVGSPSFFLLPRLGVFGTL